MKRLAITLALCAAGTLQCLACQPKMGAEPTFNGIYIDGEKICSLEGATNGGGISNPRAGRSTRMDLYVQPTGSDVRVLKARAIRQQSAVSIRGYKYFDKKYKKAGSSVNAIIVDCPQVSRIALTLDQGRYRGTNPNVKSVSFGAHECSEGSCHTFFEIRLKDGRNIAIRYSGPTISDGKH